MFDNGGANWDRLLYLEQIQFTNARRCVRPYIVAEITDEECRFRIKKWGFSIIIEDLNVTNIINMKEWENYYKSLLMENRIKKLKN